MLRNSKPWLTVPCIDTVRFIMNEAFEHSSADSSLLANKKDDTAAHDDPTYSETKSMVNVIDLTLNDKSSLNSNPEPTDDNQAHILSSSSSSSGSSDDDFRASRPAGLDSDNVSLNPRKRKYASLHQQSKGKERAEETDMQGILSNDAFVRTYIYSMSCLCKISLLLLHW